MWPHLGSRRQVSSLPMPTCVESTKSTRSLAKMMHLISKEWRDDDDDDDTAARTVSRLRPYSLRVQNRPINQ